MPQSEVIEIKHQGIELFELSLTRDGLPFEPGDCISLFNDAGVSRPYSIASGQQDDCLRFLIRTMPKGEVTHWLATRSPGDTVEISAPFGWFRPARAKGPGERFVFVATGTGITPFLSALRSYPDDTPLACLYGVRQLADALKLDYLRKRCPLQLSVSRENAPPHHHGRVTDRLDTLPVDDEVQYYLCGLDAMIDEISQWLEARGVDITHIHREVFFNA